MTRPARGARGRRDDVVRRLVDSVGGRYSAELGIDVDRGGRAVERWFLAATLFGTRISADIALRTYRVFAGAGVETVADARSRSWEELVALLDDGGYARYDFRTATRLHQLADALTASGRRRVASLARVTDPGQLEATLDALPGWGPTTVRVFLRELRGSWPGARTPLDDRARWASAHLGVPLPRGDAAAVSALERVAGRAALDVRDVEAGLVRLALTHRRDRTCPGGAHCHALS